MLLNYDLCTFSAQSICEYVSYIWHFHYCKCTFMGLDNGRFWSIVASHCRPISSQYFLHDFSNLRLYPSHWIWFYSRKWLALCLYHGNDLVCGDSRILSHPWSWINSLTRAKIYRQSYQTQLHRFRSCYHFWTLPADRHSPHYV